jgi:hypothetical protein
MRGRTIEQDLIGLRVRRGLTRLTELGLGYMVWLVLPLAVGMVITLALWAAL